MKKSIIISLFSLLYFSSLSAQSTERFIRIIGNAEHTYQSNMTRVSFLVNEIAPNEYKKISYQPLEKAYEEFVNSMKEIGFSEDQIISTNSEINKYTKTKTRNYFIDVASQNKLDDLSGIQNAGFKVTGVKYLFTNIDQDIENRLSLDAIKDAKRKAKNICSEIDMKLGKILNIEDQSSGCCSSIEASKNPEVIKKYTISITFELID